MIDDVSFQQGLLFGQFKAQRAVVQAGHRVTCLNLRARLGHPSHAARHACGDLHLLATGHDAGDRHGLDHALGAHVIDNNGRGARGGLGDGIATGQQGQQGH